MKTQQRFLIDLLRRHEKTGFGRKYEFAHIRGVKGYQERVPLHTWDDLLPYMEEVWKGNHNVLFPPDDPIVMYAESSGTTGRQKFIPVTKMAYHQSHEKTWDLTWSIVTKEIPDAFMGKVCYFPGNAAVGHIGDIPYGAISARGYLKQNRLIKTVYAYPYQVAAIEDYGLRYYTIARLALEEDISFIAIVNPSTILVLLRTILKQREDIIDDIRRGHLRHAEQIPQPLRELLLRRLRPNPSRARELEEIHARTGTLLPRDYWPRLCIVMCMSSGPLKLYVSELTNFIDVAKTKIFDFGIVASEGRLTIPVESGEEGCCPTIESNFFEFIPEDEIESASAPHLTIDQCELGKRYFVIISNSSGLYRYNISDVVRVTGFYENTPLLAFCNKGKNYSSITGEKLTEFQVTESARIASEKTGYKIEDFVVCLHWDKEMPCYALLKPDDEPTNRSTFEKFVNCMEAELMKLNNEYASKRKSLRLGPLTLKVVHGSGYDTSKRNRRPACSNIGQHKHIFLVADADFEKQFEFSLEIPAKQN